MIEISPSIRLDDSEVQLEFIRSSGPGGQNINKVATAAQLRFDVFNSPSLAVDVKSRLAKLAGSKMTADGVLVIEAKRFRTQEQNREDAVQRLASLIQKAAQPPVPRRATRPTLASKRERVEGKRKRGEIKRSRRMISGQEE